VATWPLQISGSIGLLTSGWGWRTIKGKRGFHPGWDQHAPIGSEVHAVMGGRVIRAAWDAGSGCAVFVRHEEPPAWLQSEYMHLSAYGVEVGDHVEEQQPIALSGNTGASLGAHLHLGFRASGAWIAANKAGWHLRPDEDYRRSAGGGYVLNPGLFLSDAAIVAMPPAPGVSGFGDLGVPIFHLKRWCIEQGTDRAMQILAGAGALAFFAWAISGRRR
jgi:murein DD-endopeptidase MepM/ murein hydrolase activator NlpD